MSAIRERIHRQYPGVVVRDLAGVALVIADHRSPAEVDVFAYGILIGNNSNGDTHTGPFLTSQAVAALMYP